MSRKRVKDQLQAGCEAPRIIADVILAVHRYREFSREWPRQAESALTLFEKDDREILLRAAHGPKDATGD